MFEAENSFVLDTEVSNLPVFVSSGCTFTTSRPSPPNTKGFREKMCSEAVVIKTLLLMSWKVLVDWCYPDIRANDCQICNESLTVENPNVSGEFFQTSTDPPFL